MIKYKSGHTAFPTFVCAPSKDSDKPACLCTLIRVFAGHSVGSEVSKVSSGGQRKTDAQTDLVLRWVHIQPCRKCCAPPDI